jgi:hypothetical protein
MHEGKDITHLSAPLLLPVVLANVFKLDTSRTWCLAITPCPHAVTVVARSAHSPLDRCGASAFHFGHLYNCGCGRGLHRCNYPSRSCVFLTTEFEASRLEDGWQRSVGKSGDGHALLGEHMWALGALVQSSPEQEESRSQESHDLNLPCVHAPSRSEINSNVI